MNAEAIFPPLTVYVRKDTAYVLDIAKAEAGYFMDVEPVRVARLDDLQSLTSAIKDAMASMDSGVRTIPTPTRDAFPKPALLKYAGVKTWKAFEKVGTCFCIYRGSDETLVEEAGHDRRGAWVTDPSLDQKLPPNVSALNIAKLIVERVSQRDDLS